MFHPKAAYAHLFEEPAGRGAWVFVRRPLFVAFVLGCMVSLLTLRSLSLRLISSSMVGWAFLPLFEIASLLAVLTVWRARRATVPWPAAVDLFFTGHAPWLLWAIGFGAFWSSVPHSEAFFVAFLVWVCSVCPMVIWSGYIDLCFFRRISTRPVLTLFLQRAISWTLILAVWGGGWLPSEIGGRLGL